MNDRAMLSLLVRLQGNLGLLGGLLDETRIGPIIDFISTNLLNDAVDIQFCRVLIRGRLT
jgi:hypothetical protein